MGHDSTSFFDQQRKHRTVRFNATLAQRDMVGQRFEAARHVNETQRRDELAVCNDSGPRGSAGEGRK